MSRSLGLRNRNVKCAGRAVVRDARNQPILGPDGERQYRPCQNFAANGTRFCQKHGGSFEPTVLAAKRRLLYGAEDLVEILERIARDERQPPAVRIKAINSYLDRAGIRGGQEITIETPGWQRVLGKMFGVDQQLETVESTEPVPKKAGRPPKHEPGDRARPAFEGWE